MIDKDLLWRIEATFRYTWPALEQISIVDWVSRFSNGLSRRANSANPVCEPQRDFETTIAAVEALYRGRGLSTIFRFPSFIDAAAEQRLDRLGYAPEGETSARYADIADLPQDKSAEVSLAPRPTPEWLAAIAALQRQAPAQTGVYARIVGLIEAPAMFASVERDGQIVAVGYGAIHDRLLSYNSVGTHPDHRGRGHARRILATLTAWAKRNGADGACLAVDVDNAGGNALYDSFGLRRELYRYRYWREPSIG
jgi:ribosomal protein S18 acetylase RimI-like enzyme